MPSKSVFRQPGAKHFQLVHRSQRDPLIHDPDASSHVLRPFERENAKKGKSRADLEPFLSPEDLAEHSNAGEASLYGIFYDDSDYDYMQHLRTAGVQEDGVESILIEAAATSKQKSKELRKGSTTKNNFLLPAGVLASTSELPRTFESSQAVPDSIAGFQPDMDAHLRQVLEALEDDAFVDGNLEDDFFTELVADGERASDEEVAFEFREEGVEEPEELEENSHGQAEDDWEARFQAFKNSHNSNANKTDDEDSDGGDTIGTLPTISVIGGKCRRRKGSSDASGYSMSSSSMYRNEALQTLDERFDQMMMKQYNEDEEDQPTSEDGDQSDEAPELITSRDDFDSMVNEFLNDYEILGRKMKHKLDGDTGADKLNVLRQAMGQDERVRIADGDDSVDDLDLFPEDKDDEDKWDCETILTTHTNLENHPRIIRARDSKPVPKIQLDRRTGLPSLTSTKEKVAKEPREGVSFAEDSGESSDHVVEARATFTRPRNESKEDKKARKSVTKEEKQSRRIEKKATKEQFGAALKDQKKKLATKESRMKKL